MFDLPHAIGGQPILLILFELLEAGFQMTFANGLSFYEAFDFGPLLLGINFCCIGAVRAELAFETE